MLLFIAWDLGIKMNGYIYSRDSVYMTELLRV